MNKQIARIGVLLLLALLWWPWPAPAADDRSALTVAPFVEYDYLADMGGAEDLLDRINAGLGGWLRGYDDIDLFQHLVLVGAEVRLARPKIREGLEFFASLAGTTGSAGVLGGDYDKGYNLRSIPDIPGLPALPDLPFINIDGRVHLRVDQSLDYFIPLQVGVRYEPHPDRPFSVFGSFSGGVLFFKGGMDIDVDLTGTLDSLTVHGLTAGSFRGETEMKDMGWTMNALVGVRHQWRPNLSSSLALGLGIGRLKDRVHINGKFTGDVSVDSLLADIDAPVSLNLDTSESLDLRVDGFRLRLVLAEWTW